MAKKAVAPAKADGIRYQIRPEKYIGAHYLTVKNTKSGKRTRRRVSLDDGFMGIVTIGHPSELGGARDKFICLDPGKEQVVLQGDDLSDATALQLEMIQREDESGWDVFNLITKRPVNDGVLTEKEALAIVEASQSDAPVKDSEEEDA